MAVAPAHRTTRPDSIACTLPCVSTSTPATLRPVTSTRRTIDCAAIRRPARRSHRRGQIAAGDAHAPATDLVHRVRSPPGRSRIVGVIAAREAEGRARVEEPGLPRNELAPWMPADGYGAVLRVPLAPHVEVVLEALERGQACVPAPVAQTERCPLVVVARLAAQRDARVDCRRPADDAPARKPERADGRGGRGASVPSRDGASNCAPRPRGPTGACWGPDSQGRLRAAAPPGRRARSRARRSRRRTSPRRR